MNHIRPNPPSRGFLVALLRRFENQRSVFLLASPLREAIAEPMRVVDDRPIYANGIYMTVRRGLGLDFRYEFRDVLFEADGRPPLMIFGHRRYNKRQPFQFKLRDMADGKIRSTLARETPSFEWISTVDEGQPPQGVSKPGVSATPEDSGPLVADP